MPVIEARELIKEFRVFQRREGLRGALLDLFHRRYQLLRAVDRLSFRIERGERVGCLGPNGAGKSTTLKMLTGILRPTSGSVSVAGLDPHRERERCVARIGAVFGQRSQLWWDLAPVESFKLLASVYGVGQADLRRRLEEFEGPLGIGKHLRVPVRKLSLGEKMRCELAAALLHSPEVVFLDEPTIGLDLLAKEGIRRFLLEENRRRGVTLILTTHDLSDIEELCERVLVIDRGRLIHDGPLAELKRRTGGSSSLLFHLQRRGPEAAKTGAQSTLVESTGAQGPAAPSTVAPSAGAPSSGAPNAGAPNGGRLPAELLADLEALTAGRQVSWAVEEGGAVRATFPARSVPRAEVIRRVLERFEVADIAMAEEKIEDVIRRLYASGGEPRSSGEESKQ